MRRLILIIMMAGAWMTASLSAADTAPSPLAASDTQPAQAALPPIPPLPELPPLAPTLTRPEGAPANAGTPGRALRAPEPKPATTFAILADRTGGTDVGFKYLKTAVDELNLLQPEFVMTVGDLVQGYTRDPAEYIREVVEYRGIVDRLTMPWYPCAGNHDVTSGLRNPADKRFETLYQTYFGPLYYSLDYSDIHLIVLYSDEQRKSDPVISAEQIDWLRADLNRAFSNGTTKHVFVFLHKPAWRYKNSNWDKVHKLLTDFNSRPIVTVEGLPGRAASAPPRVEAVVAGHYHTYIQEPLRDGIQYLILSVTGAAIDQVKTAGQFNQYLLVKVAPTGPEFSIVEPGSINGKDFVIRKDRDILDRIVRMDDATMGITGSLDEPVSKPAVNLNPVGILPAVPLAPAPAPATPLELHLKNPLDVPLTVLVRMASMANLTTQQEKDAANPYTENFDSPWQLNLAQKTFVLKPGESQAAPMSLTWPTTPGQKITGEVSWPQVELVVTYQDSKGRQVPTVLRRRVPVVPQVTVPMIGGAPTENSWNSAYRGRMHAVTASYSDKTEPSPDLYLLADRETLWLKVHASDSVKSYYPDFSEPWNLPSDAVAFSFTPAGESNPAKMVRIVVLPFAANGPQILTNTGAMRQQGKLLPINDKLNVTARVTSRTDAWDLYIGIPRKLLPGGPFNANVVVTDNDDSGSSTARAWSRDIPAVMPKITIGDEK